MTILRKFFSRVCCLAKRWKVVVNVKIALFSCFRLYRWCLSDDETNFVTYFVYVTIYYTPWRLKMSLNKSFVGALFIGRVVGQGGMWPIKTVSKQTFFFLYRFRLAKDVTGFSFFWASCSYLSFHMQLTDNWTNILNVKFAHIVFLLLCLIYI